MGSYIVSVYVLLLALVAFMEKVANVALLVAAAPVILLVLCFLVIMELIATPYGALEWALYDGRTNHTVGNLLNWLFPEEG